MNWFYAKNGAQEGPVSTEALRAKIDSGEVAPTDLAWREGLADWMPVSKIPDFTRQDVLQPTVGYEAPPSPPVATSSPYVAPAQPAGPASYQQPVPGGFVTPSSGLAIGAMICGILSFLSCCFPYIELPLGIAAIVMGHIAVSKVKSDPVRYAGKGMARTGLVLGYIGLVISLLIGIFAIRMYSATKDMNEQQKEEYLENAEWLPLPQNVRDQVREQMKAKREQQRQQLETPPKVGP
ncbi:MAG: serine/threonine protein kinase [Akkermansiaceae bacterium]|nr:serine/threonine protein kinase [Akkermansiaceae bacterium]